MKIVIAPDSFKESLSALAVADAIETGLRRVLPHAHIVKIPMADGGEGTVQSLIDATQGTLHTTEVSDPLGKRVAAFFGVSGDQHTAIVEMAAASGLHWVDLDKRNPLKTSSYGTGELIQAALNLGVKHIILGIGGSATNDGGAGMLQALGAQFFNHNNQLITEKISGGILDQIARVDFSIINQKFKGISVEVACDVNNPLCGERGASAIFAPQKGATPDMVAILDKNLQHYAHIIQQNLNTDIATPAGSGAAGGMGGGLLTLPHVQLKSGVQIVLDTVRLAEHIADADFVITGEGRMDAQSIAGKTPIGVARTAKQFGKPVIAIVGSLRTDYEVVYQHGIDAVFPIIRQLDTLPETLANARENLISTAQNVAKLMTLA